MRLQKEFVFTYSRIMQKKFLREIVYLENILKNSDPPKSSLLETRRYFLLRKIKRYEEILKF